MATGTGKTYTAFQIIWRLWKARNPKETHLFGDLYEQILKDLQSAGNAGEFYTPKSCDSIYG